MDFREDDEKERLELPTTLTNTERKFVHEIAGQLGLKSKSTGKGEGRRIAVTKLNAAAGVRKHEEEALPVLLVGRQGTEALRKHMTQFPPSHTEELESHETGASIMEALAAHQDDAEVANRLQQLGLMNSHDKEAPRFERKAKGVNLQRRRQLHAAAQQAKKSHRDYKRMQQGRSKLPACGHEAEIVRTVRENPITIVSGETGCGKRYDPEYREGRFQRLDFSLTVHLTAHKSLNSCWMPTRMPISSSHSPVESRPCPLPNALPKSNVKTQLGN
jgi:hypothetical protein